MSSRGSTSRRTRESAGDGGVPVTITKNAHVETAARALFGHNVADATLAKLGGAQPGDTVKLSGAPDGHLLMVNVDAPDGSHFTWRGISRTGSAALHILNMSLAIHASGQQQGLGTRILATQVKATARLGGRYLVTTGARGDDPANPVSGYKVWPALGYNARIPASLRGSLPDTLTGARTLLDLYALPGGRAWWAQHGIPTQMYFNLRAGSRSRQVLAAALKRRG